MAFSVRPIRGHRAIGWHIGSFENPKKRSFLGANNAEHYLAWQSCRLELNAYGNVNRLYGSTLLPKTTQTFYIYTAYSF